MARKAEVTQLALLLQPLYHLPQLRVEHRAILEGVQIVHVDVVGLELLKARIERRLKAFGIVGVALTGNPQVLPRLDASVKASHGRLARPSIVAVRRVDVVDTVSQGLGDLGVEPLVEPHGTP